MLYPVGIEYSKVGSQSKVPLNYSTFNWIRSRGVEESDEKEIRQLSHDAKLTTPAPVLLEEY